jgi:DNA-binding MarR family transcriptional regulator
MTATRKRPRKQAKHMESRPRKRASRSKVADRATGTPIELKTLQCLRTIFGTARTHDAEVRRSAEISGSQLWALAEIARRPGKQGITVNGLSVQMALHQTTTSNLVNSLVERGLIRRERDEVDQRVVHLCATPHGKQLLLRTPGPHAGLLVDALRQLDDSQVRRLFESLGWLVACMRRTAETAAGETLLGE